MSKAWKKVKSWGGAALGFALGGAWGAIYGALYDLYKWMKPDTPDTPSSEPGARTLRSSKAPARYILGRAATGGVLAFAQEQPGAQTDGELLHLVYVLSEGAVTGIDEIRLNEELIATFGAYASYQLVTNPTVADPYLLANCPDWREDMIGRGLSYLRVTLKYNAEKFQGGLPDIRVVVRGIPVYDPRTGAEAYSENTALHILWYLRERCGVPASEIVMDSFAAAASVCDELVQNPDGSYSPRYRTGCVIGADEKKTQVLDKLTASCAGRLLRVGGKWMLQVGAYYGPADFTITESMVIGTVSGSTEVDNAHALNTVRGTFIDPSQGWADTDYPEVSVAEWLAEDGGEAAESLNFSYVTDVYQAQRLASIELRKRRTGGVLKLPMNFLGYNCRPGRVVTVDLPSLNIHGEFVVADWEMSPEEACSVTLEQYVADVWDDAVGRPYTPLPFISITNPAAVPPPQSVAVTEELYAGLDGLLRNRAIVSWESGGGLVRSYEVEYRSAQDTAWRPAGNNILGSSCQISDLDVGLYRFRVRAYNVFSIASFWVEVTYQLLGQANPPPRPIGVTLRNGLISWSYPNPPLDFKGFEIRYQPGTRKTWVDAIKLHEGYLTTTRLAANELPSGTVTILVRAIDWSGNQSESAYVTVGIGDPVVQNIVYEVSHAAEGWTGTVTGGEITPAGVVANESTRFWADDDAVFWSPSGNGLFWRPAWETLIYEWGFIPPADALPAQLTIAVDSSASNLRIEWIAPDRAEFWGEDDDLVWGDDQANFWAPDPAEWSEWPGSDDVRNRQRMRFRVIVPGVQSGTQPAISDIRMILDVEDVSEVIEAFGVVGGEARLPISLAYRRIRVVSLTIHDDGSGAVSAKIVDKSTELGPLIRTLDELGNPVETIIDARIQGY